MNEFTFKNAYKKEEDKIIEPAENIGYNFSYWGPLLWWSKITDDFKNGLLQRGNKTNIDNRPHLAGHLEKENAYDKDDQLWFSKNFYPYLNAYEECFNNDWKDGANIDRNRADTIRNANKKYFDLTGLWINYMKPGDFNPPHYHSGDLSFVIYLKVPEELKKENESFVGKSSGPGSVYFSWGEHQEHMITNRKFLPEENQVFIFPATLNHMVFPFKSNCERISVAGNVRFVYE